jgi:hypothetical protein
MGGNCETSRQLGALEGGLSHGVRIRARDGVFLAIVAWLALAASPGFAAADSVGPQYTPALPSATGQSSPGEEGIAPPEQQHNNEGVQRASDTYSESDETPVATESQIDSRTATPAGPREKIRNPASGAAPKKDSIAHSERDGSATADDGGGEFPWLGLMLAGVALAAIVSLLRLFVRRRRSGGNQPAPG